MSHKRKKIKEDDFNHIGNIILKQLENGDDRTEVAKEMDPEGLIPWTNRIACRNILQHLAEYFDENFSDELFDYNYFSRAIESHEGAKRVYGRDNYRLTYTEEVGKKVKEELL